MILGSSQETYVAQRTKGGGDCALHAALGVYNPATGQVEAIDIGDKRKQVADVIRTCQSHSSLFSLVKTAIIEHVMASGQMMGPNFSRLKDIYTKHMQDDDVASQVKWSVFERELYKHPEFLNRIEQFIEHYILDKHLDGERSAQLRARSLDKFMTCISEEASFKETIMASPLSTAYREFDTEGPSINWDLLTDDPALLEEYAAFFSTEGAWLLPCELQLIAHVFNIHIIFQNAQATPEHYNAEGAHLVHVYFNGVNHFERMGSEVLQSAIARPMIGSQPSSLSEEAEVWRLVEESRRKLVEAKDKRLILLVGATGAGKSSLINYLNGSEMEYAPLPDRPRGKRYLQIKSGQPVYAEVGHNARRSKTLHPQAISAVPTTSPLAYVDLPGSSDAHLSEAERLCASIALPMAIHYAEAIAGIIVVIDIQSFAVRGQAFSDFINLLGGLFDPSILVATEALTSPLMFVFTHVNRREFGEVSEILLHIEETKDERIAEIPVIIQSLVSSLQVIATKLNRMDELLNVLELLRTLAQMPESAPQAYLAFFKAIEELLKTYKPLLFEGDADYDHAKTHYGNLNDAYYELIALDIMLKYKDSPHNQFIIDGEGPDDREKLLGHIQRLSQRPPIDKKYFIFQGRAGKEWLQLDALLQKTAEKASALKQILAECPQEISAIKKYRGFLKERHQKHVAMLHTLQVSQESSVESVLSQLHDLDAELEQHLAQELKERKTEQDKSQAELDLLDTAEAMRYFHPSLGPVNCSVSTTRQIGFGIAATVTGLVLFGPVYAGSFLAGIIGIFLDPIRSNVPFLPVARGSIEAMTTTMVIGIAPAVFLAKKAMGIIASFSYNDLPFIKIELNPNYLAFQSRGHNIKIIEDLDDDRLNTFYKETLKEDKEKGIFEISGRFNCPDVHIKLFVEQRIHPDIKPHIDLLKQRLERLCYAMSQYFQVHLTEHKAEQEALIACDTAVDKKAALITLLTQRIGQYPLRFRQLNGYLHGYKSSIRDADYAWHAHVIPHIETMAMIYAVVGSQREFVKQLIADARLFSTQAALKIVTHPLTIWGRKATPVQTIDYQVKAKKKAGSSIGAEYHPVDKPDARWMGKLGLKELSDDDMPGTMGTRAYHGRAIEALKEKIASDFFSLLSEGAYGVPKTRLAEIPLRSLIRSIDPEVYNEIVVARVNHERVRDRVSQGIFLMSKYWPDYHDLHDLENCILGEENISFLGCLKVKNLPEFVHIEGKNIPIRGLMELLATARLLGDSDVLGVEGKNSGFVVERDMYHRALCVRIVKIDPGFAFDFSETNPFRLGIIHQHDPDPLKPDGRNIQYAANSGCILPWVNLSDAQQRIYLQTLHHVLQQLRQKEFLDLVLAQEGFKAAPSGKVLRFVETFTRIISESLTSYLDAQEGIFAKELKPYSHVPSRNSFEQLASQYGLYAPRSQLVQDAQAFGKNGVKQENDRPGSGCRK